MNGQDDFDVLAELGEYLAQLEQRTGNGPGRVTTSLNLRIAKFAMDCERGLLRGRARKAKSKALFLEAMRALGKML